jgi:murein DD-endopeptidase MepM/ murein hydrolase activator NlpD
MNARRATAFFRDAFPARRSSRGVRSVPFNWPRPFGRPVRARALMQYIAALATVMALALFMSYAARRVMPPLTAGMDHGGVTAPVTDGQTTARTAAPARRAARTAASPARVAAAGASVSGVGLPPAIEELRRRHLSLPVNGVRAEQLVPTFDEARGDRPHEAIDIMAPRGTPVVATEDGRIAKLFWSKAGGHTIYQFDPTDTYVYYYAHLDRYADDLAEGRAVRRGQTIGYVGSTGNAKADAPHLHFAIFLLTPEKRWWDGAALDPYPVLRWNIDGGTP